jgi:hypothetical protein
MKIRSGFAAIGAMIVLAPAIWAQSTTPKNTLPSSTNPHSPNTLTKKEPCWQQAGVSRSALEQRHQIAAQMHQQIESVCHNSSLTAQQRHQQIQQIREQAQSRMSGLVSPSQMQSIKSCRAQRGESVGGGMHHGSGMGPCGEMPGMHANGKTPANNPKQTMEPDEPVD